MPEITRPTAIKAEDASPRGLPPGFPLNLPRVWPLELNAHSVIHSVSRFLV